MLVGEFMTPMGGVRIVLARAIRNAVEIRKSLARQARAQPDRGRGAAEYRGLTTTLDGFRAGVVHGTAVVAVRSACGTALVPSEGMILALITVKPSCTRAVGTLRPSAAERAVAR